MSSIEVSFLGLESRMEKEFGGGNGKGSDERARVRTGLTCFASCHMHVLLQGASAVE